MGWKATDIPDQRGRIAVVTGANSGLGLEASRELARQGATVVMAVRDLDKGTAALADIRAGVPAADLELRKLDLGSLASVQAFVGTVLGEHPVIDILINNAGIMATPASETQDGFESQIGTNHFGHFVLTEGLLPTLEQATAGRVVTLTSVARLRGRPLTETTARLTADYDAWQAYADAKFANYQFGMELARRLTDSGSSVSSLVAHPGLSNTNLQAASVEHAGAGLQGRIWRVLARFVGLSAADGALSGLRAATDPGAGNGEFFGPRWNLRGAPVKVRVGDTSTAREDAERMWQISEAQTGTVFRPGA